MALSVLLSVLLLTCVLTDAFSEVIVYRCCPKNQTLSPSWECTGAVKERSWAPVVYVQDNGTFITPGTVPDTWRYSVRRPECRDKQQIGFFRSKPDPPAFVTLLDGRLLTSPLFKEAYQTSEFCLDQTGALVCTNFTDEREILIPKCCGTGGSYSERQKACFLTKATHWEFMHLNTVQKFPDCPGQGPDFVIGGKLNLTHWLKENGTLEDDEGRKLSPDEFCLEKIEENLEGPVHVFTCPPIETGSKRHNDIRFTLYPLGFFLSVFFLAVTLIASCLLPSTYHVLHWRCQTNHVACLLIGDLLLAVTQLSGDALQGPGCVFIAISMHFIFLAAFFWLNTMCFNIWWTFRDLRPASLDKGQEACRLRIYELYAWGGPLLIAGIGAIFDHLPDKGHNLIRPRFGEHRCWFYGDAELLYYFFGPIGVLLLLNLTLFAATARELTCGLWKTEVVKSNTERAALGRVCLKLVVVMGVTWVADVVSWAVGGPDYIWYLTDIINALQGVLIFAVVGCQPQVWAGVKRLWCMSGSPNDNHNVRSSSSHALPSLNDQNTSITNTSTKAIETLC
ncbi:probable G-protein coupled receptor Mth-like 1 [Cimex lectularius]|uniref:G-protein coupled receptors family 2 profile 2 domain-containing protein n=1 Tax=Cimex lectularius TaxID=79782 RepID=A0A8I6RN44_CIMLE|nr:probable G-protein coupled receptor Mth-like 1 [Cimex lectularius]